MSFFSKKTPVQEEKSIVNNDAVVKTMQDDLNIINGTTHQQNPLEKEISPQNLENKMQQSVINTPLKSMPVQQNPFISQKETGEIPRTPIHTNQTEVMNEKLSPNAPHTSKFIIALIGVIILTLMGGVLYFIATRTTPIDTSSEKETMDTKSQTPPTQTPIDKEKSLPFSIDTPNYLPIDTLNSTPQSIQAILVQTAQQATSLTSLKPVEFLVTDINNNPLSFASFAKLSDITLSQATLNSLGDSFSLFIYTDNQVSHIGLTIELKNKDMLPEALQQEEPALTQTLEPLFLNDIPTKTAETFNDGIYQGISLRYINIHPETALSIDYAIINQHLVISTSMKTHHALLDIVK